MCVLVAAVVSIIGGSASIMTVTVIALDRYLALRLKTGYKSVVTTVRVKVVVLLIWLVSFFLSSLPFITSPLAASIFGAIGVLFCLIITIVFYILLFVALKKHCVQISTQGDQCSGSSNQTIDIIKYKKLLKTMLIVLAFIIFCYSFMAGGLAVITNADQRRSTQWGLLTIVGLNSTFNPVIYICRMRELQKACYKVIRKYFTCRKCDVNLTHNEQIELSAKPTDCG